MPIVEDMMGRSVDIPAFPSRIISLVPSQTELLFDLGLGDRVVGVTKFCIHPGHARRTARVVGGTKQIHPDRIAALHPDLVIGNKEENERGMIEDLEARYPVWMSDIRTLEDARAMILALGGLCGNLAGAQGMIAEIDRAFAALSRPHTNRPRVAYLIWKDPWMGVGGNTFIHDLIEKAGFINVLADQSRYPRLEPTSLRDLRPEHVLLSSEPYPFRQPHVEEIGQYLPDCRVQLVNGEFFSWYGSRLIRAGAYLDGLSQKLSVSG